MSILIRGMKMPETCGSCSFFEMPHQDYPYCRLTNNDIYDWGKKQKNCPLIELPPHGRLIDADVLMEKAFRYQIHGKPTLKVVLASALRDAPTIIESEK